MNKGFTLIELLAVIIILAILMLFAVPTVLDKINKAKEKALLISTMNILNSAKTYYALSGPSETDISNLNYEGNELVGKIKISSNGKLAIHAYDNTGICVTKGFNDEEVVLVKSTEEECTYTISSSAEVISSAENTSVTKTNYLTFSSNNEILDNYKIDGNSMQIGTPTPDNPLEIKNVGILLTSENCNNYGSSGCENLGKYVIEIKVTGKNLFDKSKVKSTVNLANFSGWVDMMLSNEVSKEIFQSNKTYSLKWTVKTVSDPADTYSTPQLAQFNGFSLYSPTLGGITSYGATRIPVGSTQTYFKTISLPSWIDTSSDVSLRLYNQRFVSSTGAVSFSISEFSNIQIEYGSVSTSYEEYKEKKYYIYLSEPLRKVGVYSDYIDFEKGVVVRNVAEKVLNGTETYYIERATYTYPDYYTVFSLKKVTSSDNEIIASHFIYGSITTPGNYSGRTNNKAISFTTQTVYTAQSFKNWVLGEYQSGTPLDIIYVLETPTTTSIELPEISVYSGSSTISILGASKMEIVK